MQVKLETPIVLRRVNPVKNSSGALNPAGIILKSNPAAELRGIISNGVKIIGPAGIREMDVVLDTGAVYTVIAWDVAKDIGYDPAISERRMPIITANGVIEAPLITVASIQMADIRAEAVDVICHDIPEITGIEGLLGRFSFRISGRRSLTP